MATLRSPVPCIVCGTPTFRSDRLCGHHLNTHDPVPDHHIAAARACLRCGEEFESTWSGDRVCPRCRERQYDAERACRWNDSPLEPEEIPPLEPEEMSELA